MRNISIVLLVAFTASLTASAQSNDIIKERVRKAHQSSLMAFLLKITN
jgi:hypothetical protein